MPCRGAAAGAPPARAVDVDSTSKCGAKRDPPRRRGKGIRFRSVRSPEARPRATAHGAAASPRQVASPQVGQDGRGVRPRRSGSHGALPSRGGQPCPLQDSASGFLQVYFVAASLERPPWVGAVRRCAGSSTRHKAHGRCTPAARAPRKNNTARNTHTQPPPSHGLNCSASFALLSPAPYPGALGRSPHDAKRHHDRKDGRFHCRFACCRERGWGRGGGGGGEGLEKMHGGRRERCEEDVKPSVCGPCWRGASVRGAHLLEEGGTGTRAVRPQNADASRAGGARLQGAAAGGDGGRFGIASTSFYDFLYQLL